MAFRGGGLGRRESSPGRRQDGGVSLQPISLKSIVTFIIFGTCCFYAGVLVGTHSVSPPSMEEVCAKYLDLESVMSSRLESARKVENMLRLRYGKRGVELDQLHKNLESVVQEEHTLRGKFDHEGYQLDRLTKERWEPRFPPSVGSFAQGMALLDRKNFTERFDVGVPLDEEHSSVHNEKVLLLYAHQGALPTARSDEARSNGHIPLMGDVEEATANCDTVNVILAQPSDPRQCFAVMGQYRSYHIQKFMRLPETEGEPLDRKAPLRLVNRGAQTSGRLSFSVPSEKETAEYWETLKNYLNTLDNVLEQLQPLAKKVAHNNNNTVIVMVCNHGQSELLMNFVCSAKARGLDVSSVLVFATDKETKELAEGLGLVSFYDETNYGGMPKQAAGRYADATFTAMMMAKVYCVQQITMLGYDVLFQDVDMVWYRNPLEFFHNTSSPMYHHEMYFQDDGSRGLFYAPYSANTGMYYVRNNDKTRYFFNSLLLAGDLIKSTHSHQIALVSLLSEHASMHGLRVKVLSRDTPEFPGGYAFHNRQNYMKQLLSAPEGETVKPYLFHMSWTSNKKNKERFFRQMGNWYLNDICVESTASEILAAAGGDKQSAIHHTTNATTSGSLLAPCCLVEPEVHCFYSDKPSIIPCKDSPPLDQDKESFW